MTAYVIQVVGFATGRGCLAAGQYLVESDPDAFDGRGHADFHTNVKLARRFESPADALAYWQQVSTVRPRRPDGKPNRPLTAFTVVVKKVD